MAAASTTEPELAADVAQRVQKAHTEFSDGTKYTENIPFNLVTVSVDQAATASSGRGVRVHSAALHLHKVPATRSSGHATVGFFRRCTPSHCPVLGQNRLLRAWSCESTTASSRRCPRRCACCFAQPATRWVLSGPHTLRPQAAAVPQLKASLLPSAGMWEKSSDAKVMAARMNALQTFLQVRRSRLARLRSCVALVARVTTGNPCGCDDCARHDSAPGHHQDAVWRLLPRLRVTCAGCVLAKYTPEARQGELAGTELVIACTLANGVFQPSSARPRRSGGHAGRACPAEIGPTPAPGNGTPLRATQRNWGGRPQAIP